MFLTYYDYDPESNTGISRPLVQCVDFFYLGFKACHGFFTHFEPSHSVGVVKTGDP